MADAEIWNAVLLASLWLGYFVLHSALASFHAKTRIARAFPGWVPFYRVSYNVFSLLTLLPIIWLLFHRPGTELWSWDGRWSYLANGLALAALVGFACSAHHYDMEEFIGWRRGKTRPSDIEEADSLRISPFHRHVRHPWYAFGLVLIWTRDMNVAMLVSAVLLTAYLFIGAHLEEKRLIKRHGDAYRRYMQRVPGLIPLPGKSISAQEAAELVSMSEDKANNDRFLK